MFSKRQILALARAKRWLIVFDLTSSTSGWCSGNCPVGIVLVVNMSGKVQSLISLELLFIALRWQPKDNLFFHEKGFYFLKNALKIYLKLNFWFMLTNFLSKLRRKEFQSANVLFGKVSRYIGDKLYAVNLIVWEGK